MLKPTIFREYDIRGLADTELLTDDIVSLGKGFGTFLQRKAGPRIAVGSDCRLSSPRLKDALIRGLTSTGCEVIDVGTVPTPLVYFAQVHLKTDGAIMITGSHNPPEYNGFKTVAAGAAIYGNDIQEIRRVIVNSEFAAGPGSLSHHDVSAAYIDEIAGQFQFSRRVKIVVDAGNGTAGPVMHRLLSRLNVEPIEMFFDMDGRFPNHHPDPTLPENLEILMNAVKLHGAEMGLAFDGDSDRIGAVDEHGHVVFGDMLMLIFGREILTRKPGATFIGEVKCSQLMYDELNRLGGNAIMYKTGHSLIKAKMKQEHAELAGEMSGHMFFKDRYYGYDDALYAACRLIEIVADSGKPLSAQLAGLPKMVSTPEIRIDCPDEAKFGVVERVALDFKKKHKVIDVDGVRVIFSRGWGLLRASNTQPVLVMRFEAENDGLLKHYRDEVEAALQQAREVV
jgi:phosphomannomutase / phosphoglucomutase